MPIGYALEASAQHGFSYVEVLLSAVLLATLLTPALQALESGVAGGGAASASAHNLDLRSKMEQVLATPFRRLYAETYAAGGNTATSVSATFSDPAGQANRRVVVLYRYDASANTLSASDTGLLFVSVYYEAEGSVAALNTLTGRWW